METYVFILVLCAALFHAVWNSLVKSSASGLLTLTAITLSGTLIGLFAIPFLPYPHPDSWPYLAWSIFIHFGYALFLLLAYRVGDLSLVYPIARGCTPVLVATFSVLFVGEDLSFQGTIGVLSISLGIIALTFTKKGKTIHDLKPIIFALITSLFIAAYSLVDGLGARLAGNALSYVSWLFIVQPWPIVILCYYYKKDGISGYLKSSWKQGLFAGIFACLAYGLVVWAMSFNNIAYVSALRETSVLFAVLIGAFVLKENFGLKRFISAMLVVLGIVLIRF